MRTALLIPVYNEAGKFTVLLEEILNYFPPQDTFIVDDGSSNGCCDGIVGKYHLLRHPKNSGKGRALRTGFEAVITGDYDYVLTMDADGQHPPASIPDFLQRIQTESCDIIIGNRRKNLSGMPWDRRFSNIVTSAFLTLLAYRKIFDAQCGFRAYRIEFLKKIRLTGECFDLENEILFRAFKIKAEIGWIDIPTIYADETSHIRRGKDTYKFIKLTLKYLTGRLP